MNITGQKIREKVEKIANKYNTPQITLAEAIGVSKEQSSSYKGVKWNRFLGSLSKEKIDLFHLRKFSEFFEKDLEWFFCEEKKGVETRSIGANNSVVHGGISQDIK